MKLLFSISFLLLFPFLGISQTGKVMESLEFESKIVNYTVKYSSICRQIIIRRSAVIQWCIYCMAILTMKPDGFSLGKQIQLPTKP
jgi:hypothetical protein